MDKKDGGNNNELNTSHPVKRHTATLGIKTTKKVINHDWKIKDLNKYIGYINGSIIDDGYQFFPNLLIQWNSNKIFVVFAF